MLASLLVIGFAVGVGTQIHAQDAAYLCRGYHSCMYPAAGGRLRTLKEQRATRDTAAKYQAEAAQKQAQTTRKQNASTTPASSATVQPEAVSTTNANSSQQSGSQTIQQVADVASNPCLYHESCDGIHQRNENYGGTHQLNENCNNSMQGYHHGKGCGQGAHYGNENGHHGRQNKHGFKSYGMMKAWRDDNDMKSEEEIQNAIELHADMVQKVCVLHMKQQADAGGVFQMVFPKYAQSEPFQDREHRKAWLLRVTIDTYRRRFHGWFHKHTDLQAEMEACADFSEAFYFLLDMLDQLSPRYRDILYLFYHEDYRVRETSKIKGKNENTVHTWLKRSREVLRGKLGGELDDFR